MMAIAASKAAATPVIPKPTCKPRANCLKPKEIRPQRFDLQHPLIYLKVDIIRRNPRGALLHDPRFRDQGRRTPGRSRQRTEIVAPPADLHQPDRGRGPRPAA